MASTVTQYEIKWGQMSAAGGGGYILAGAHNIQPDISVEKVIKLFEWTKKYGRYSEENDPV